MQEYLSFMAVLTVIYLGYLVYQAREKKTVRRYYGYRSSRRRSGSSGLRRAA